MSIPYVVDGETPLDSALFNPIIGRANGLADGSVPIALPGITAALGQWTGAVNVLSEGADSTGVADSSSAIAASLDTGRAVTIPPGDFRITEQFAAANPRLIGAGSDRTTIVVPDGFDIPIFDIDDADSAYLSGFAIRAESGGTVDPLALGIRIHGDSKNVVIEDVVGDGMATTVQVGKRDTVADGLCESIHLVRVRGLNSPSSFGICIDDCDGVSLWDCAAMGNWLDGVKLRAGTKNVEIYGGTYSGNGVAWITDGSSAGDGIDAYAGGNTFLIVGGRFHGNHGNGVYIKSDLLTGSDPGRYGYVSNVRLIGVSATGNTIGSGFFIGAFASSGDIGDLPLPANIAMNACYAEGNGVYGFHVNARSVSLQSPVARLNGRSGIRVDQEAKYVQITDPLVSGNSQEGAGSYHGIYIFGKNVRVQGGTVIGIDSEAITSATDLSTLTKYHARNIYVSSLADEVEILNAFEDYNVSGQGIRTDMTSGRCVINQSEAGSPFFTGAYGSIGSEYVQKDATTGAGVVWRKVRGAPNAPITGWRRTGSVRPILTKTDDYTVVEADLGSLLIVTAATSKTIALPTAVGLDGDSITIKQGGAGAVVIDPNGTETINGLSTGTVTGFAEIVSDGANWHVVAGAVA